MDPAKSAGLFYDRLTGGITPRGSDRGRSRQRVGDFHVVASKEFSVCFVKTKQCLSCFAGFRLGVTPNRGDAASA